ncbi:MAG: hypothetical protein IPN45_04820 [Actinomycetales bacterium]|nr:hypothetical protein [Actinomycetales bacterium]
MASNPIKLARQLRANLELLVPATAQLTEIAERTRPDVILADFTAPPSGLVATRLGIPWITTMPTPFVLETRTGTPSYCGGWGPTRHVGHRVRNAAGRASTRRAQAQPPGDLCAAVPANSARRSTARTGAKRHTPGVDPRLGVQEPS